MLNTFWCLCVISPTGVEIFRIENMEASTVANCFIELICREGVPESLLSDQGRNFKSNLFKEVLELLDVHKLRTTPYHPQCDGQTETER